MFLYMHQDVAPRAGAWIETAVGLSAPIPIFDIQPPLIVFSVLNTIKNENFPRHIIRLSIRGNYKSVLYSHFRIPSNASTRQLSQIIVSS
jgi:hypothetical protein